MTQRERESLASSGDDPHSLLFGDDDSGDYPPTRADRRRADHRKGRRRRGRLFVLLAVVLVAAVAYFVVPRVVDYFSVADYSGPGTGSVSITVNAGDTTSDIANTLQQAGVVKSAQAFTDACGSSKCAKIRPGTYKMRLHMSGGSAVALILSNASRDGSNDLVIPEGETSLDVAARLTKILGSDQKAAITKALNNAADLGLPLKYTGSGDGVPKSAEGFLFPATYTIDPNSTPSKVLQELVSRYLTQDRQTGFADAAAKLHETPYDALIMASIAQSEAKYADDMPRVVRTIMNRIKIGRELEFDSTSSYACKLAGTPAAKCIYKDVNSPYNTYTHKGLPPTPIDNPGASAMSAAVSPAKGDWLYFVNKDKAGHLFFTSSEKAFLAAAAKCAKNHWGCG